MNKRLNQTGFTLVEVMIVVAIIGLLAAIAIPNFVRSREIAKENICAVNKRQIEDALQRYAAFVATSTFTDIEMTDIAPDFARNEPTCPSGGTYSWDASGTASCSVHDGGGEE